MSSITRKIDDAISEYGSMEAYLEAMGKAAAPLIPMFDQALSPLSKIIFEPQLSSTVDYKIIKVEDLEIELLIRRDVTEDNMPCVILTFFDTDSDNEEYQQEELIEFQGITTAQNFIRDYSPASAREFVEANLREPSN